MAEIDDGELMIATAFASLARQQQGERSSEIVAVDVNAPGFPTKCYGCPRVVNFPFEVPPDKAIVCPSCQRRILEGRADALRD